MAYMLSAQLVAMHNNVAVGYVDANCVINDPCLGTMTIEQLLQQAVASLCANPFTPPCSSQRSAQRKLKNALDRANNNLIWQTASCNTTPTCGSGGNNNGGPSNWRNRHRRGRRNR